MIIFLVLFFGIPGVIVVYLMSTARPGWQDENGFHEGEQP